MFGWAGVDFVWDFNRPTPLDLGRLVGASIGVDFVWVFRGLVSLWRICGGFFSFTSDSRAVRRGGGGGLTVSRVLSSRFRFALCWVVLGWERGEEGEKVSAGIADSRVLTSKFTCLIR